MIEELAKHLGDIEAINCVGYYSKIKFSWGGILYARVLQDRISCSCGFPADFDGMHFKPRDLEFKITISRSKTIERIAKDIERRLLAGYKPAYEKALEEKKKYEQGRQRARENAQKLNDILDGWIGDATSSRRNYFGKYDPFVEGHADVEGFFSIKIVCDFSLAEKICRLIAQKD